LRYTAKPNITPDNIFEKELKDIKLDAEQSLVDALTRFHKHKLEGQKKKLRAFSQPNARRNKYVTRQRFNDSQSANHIDNHNNVNLSDLQKQISDLKNIVFSHVFKNTAKKNRINSITVCSLTLRKLATKPARVFLKTNGAKTEGTHLEQGGQPKKGN